MEITAKQWTLVLDLNTVLLSRQQNASATIGPFLWKEITSSDIWLEYNRGHQDDEECWSQLAKRFSTDRTMIAEGITHARQTMALHPHLEAYIRRLRARYKEQLIIHAMFDMSTHDWQALKSREFPWPLFDCIFVSCELNMCKPELRFYSHVLHTIQTSPKDTIFIENIQEHILAAQSLGAHSLLFSGMTDLHRKVLNIIEKPEKRGEEFLLDNARHLHSITNRGHKIRDNFAQLLIYEATRNLDLVELEQHKRTWNYFIGEQALIPGDYPDDLDTTSLALLLFPVSKDLADSIMDQMLTLRTPDGIVMTYFDATRPRTDPMVCVNILRLFYHYSRGMDPSLRATKDWVHQVLLNFAYIHGTRYYTSPDVFLYYVSKLVQENPGSDICRAIVPLLTSRLRARVNADGDSIALAMRIIACQALGIPDELDLQKLLSLQSEDGGWEVGWLCCTGKRGIRIGNRGVATALAIHAIESMTSLTNIGLQMGVGTFWRNSV